jgi:hypothetical protein
LLFTIRVYSDFLRWQPTDSLPPLSLALSKISQKIGFEFG